MRSIYCKTNEPEPLRFYIGVSSNHNRVGDRHNSIRFHNHWLTIDEVLEHIKDNCFFCSPVDNPKKRPTRDGYIVQESRFFERTYLIPFDLDYMKFRMEEFLDRLPPELKPTICFKTRSNNDNDKPFKYRFLYFFNSPFTSREEYYSYYEYIRNEIYSYTDGVWEDDYAYGLNPNGTSPKGTCCKPIRTNASDEVHCTYKVFNKDDFFVPIIFHDLDYVFTEKINRELFSPDLFDLIVKYRKYDTLYQKYPFRDFSKTHTQFHNGFAYVRGNKSYVEFIRKFVVTYNEDGKRRHTPSRWDIGEHRHRKIRLDAIIARFNDFADHDKTTLTADELFMVIFDESRKYFVVDDESHSDVLGGMYLLEVVSEVMQMDMDTVIAEVEDYICKIDNTRSLVRIDRRYWTKIVGYDDENKVAIRSLVRHIGRFLKILDAYDQNQTVKYNCERLEKIKSMDSSFPGCSESCLNRFISDCKTVCSYMFRDDNNEVSSDIFSDDGMEINMNGEHLDFRYRIAELYLKEDDVLKDKVVQIATSEMDCIKTRKGNRTGRPVSQWRSCLCDEDARLGLKDLVDLVHRDYPDVPENSIKTWKYRVLKRKEEEGKKS